MKTDLKLKDHEIKALLKRAGIKEAYHNESEFGDIEEAKKSDEQKYSMLQQIQGVKKRAVGAGKRVEFHLEYPGKGTLATKLDPKLKVSQHVFITKAGEEMLKKHFKEDLDEASSKRQEGRRPFDMSNYKNEREVYKLHKEDIMQIAKELGGQYVGCFMTSRQGEKLFYTLTTKGVAMTVLNKLNQSRRGFVAHSVKSYTK